jgi:hypothetical protein
MFLDDENKEEEEIVKGDPWSILPVKTRKYAKECIEIVLSKRKITELINFDMFENLEALWLTDNRLTEIKGLDANFRIKILCCGKNRITTLEGSSISKMKFLETLYLNDNKLKNLDLVLSNLKNFSFLKNLNLFGNPVAEEPEYRPRVIYVIKSLEIFDRHKVTDMEKMKCEQIVKEYNDPLSKKKVKRPKRLKVYEKFSTIEKELFEEVDNIIKKRELDEEENKKIQQELIEKEKYPKGYIPYNNIMAGNFEKYYNKNIVTCPELEDNEMDRLFNKYDISNTGKFKKGDIQLIFFDVKDLLSKRKIEFNENKLINEMLNFYASSGDFVTKDDIKKCYGKILHGFKANIIKDKVVVTNLDYLKKLSTGNDPYLEKNTIKNIGPQRRDIFNIKCITDKEQRTVILNENRLKKMYEQ